MVQPPGNYDTLDHSVVDPFDFKGTHLKVVGAKTQADSVKGQRTIGAPLGSPEGWD